MAVWWTASLFRMDKHYSIFLSRESALWYCEAVSPDKVKTCDVIEVRMNDGTTKYLVEIVYDI